MYRAFLGEVRGEVVIGTAILVRPHHLNFFTVEPIAPSQQDADFIGNPAHPFDPTRIRSEDEIQEATWTTPPMGAPSFRETAHRRLCRWVLSQAKAATTGRYGVLLDRNSSPLRRCGRW